ncbi:type II toxin-antitoxin system prevent-host-death family antitoxin [Rhizobium binxianense]
MTVMTSREFNQDTSGAKRAAAGGPVFITDRGKPSYVLLSIEEYQRLTGEKDGRSQRLFIRRVRTRSNLKSRGSMISALSRSISPDVSSRYERRFQTSQTAGGQGGSKLQRLVRRNIPRSHLCLRDHAFRKRARSSAS